MGPGGRSTRSTGHDVRLWLLPDDTSTARETAPANIRARGLGNRLPGEFVCSWADVEPTGSVFC
jgi:hypothetical protein